MHKRALHRAYTRCACLAYSDKFSLSACTKCGIEHVCERGLEEEWAHEERKERERFDTDENEAEDGSKRARDEDKDGCLGDVDEEE